MQDLVKSRSGEYTLVVLCTVAFHAQWFFLPVVAVRSHIYINWINKLNINCNYILKLSPILQRVSRIWNVFSLCTCILISELILFPMMVLYMKRVNKKFHLISQCNLLSFLSLICYTTMNPLEDFTWFCYFPIYLFLSPHSQAASIHTYKIHYAVLEFLPFQNSLLRLNYGVTSKTQTFWMTDPP